MIGGYEGGLVTFGEFRRTSSLDRRSKLLGSASGIITGMVELIAVIGPETWKWVSTDTTSAGHHQRRAPPGQGTAKAQGEATAAARNALPGTDPSSARMEPEASTNVSAWS